MINVYRNPNFREWFNIMVNGKLVDSARTHAKALEIANQLKQKSNMSIMSSK